MDTSKEAVETIKTNAKKTKLFDRCVILNTDYKAFIRGAAGKERFDIIFLDPPYASELVQDALERLVRADLVAKGALVVCESDRKEEFSLEGFAVKRHTNYGKIYITLLERNGSEEF